MGRGEQYYLSDGVVVDLAFLNETTLASDRSFVRLGAGGTWGHTYTQLNGTGVAIPGGRVKTVGIGGLTLGDGYSWLTSKVGFVADNFLNYEVVLASGELIQTKQSNSDDFLGRSREAATTLVS